MKTYEKCTLLKFYDFNEVLCRLKVGSTAIAIDNGQQSLLFQQMFACSFVKKIAFSSSIGYTLPIY